SWNGFAQAGTVGGMDADDEATGTYSRRVPAWARPFRGAPHVRELLLRALGALLRLSRGVFFGGGDAGEFGFEEAPADLRELLLQAALDRRDVAQHLLRIVLLAHPRLHRHQRIVAQLQGDHADYVRDLGAAVEEGADLRLTVRVHALPDQHRLDLDRHQHGDHDQQRADGHGAQRVPDRVAGDHAHHHRDQGEHQAQQRGEVLAEDHHQFALPALAEPLPQAAVAAHLVHFLQAGAHRYAFGSDAEHQHAGGPPPLPQLFRVLQLVQALVHREHAADGEQ